MTPQQAQETIRKYQAVLAADDRRGARRDPSLLPTTKATVMKAIKLEIAQLYYIGSATEELLQPLIQSAMFLDSFTHEPLDTVAFVEAMQQRRADLEGFHHELLNIRRDSPFFWQQVYPLTGISEESRSETLFDTVKRKLGLRSKEPASGATTTTRVQAGRIVLD